ncbi:hypothetical protein AB0395_34535 [Streptosporangium sp. NPDC051023]|uniref:hypothetical protein n=1 Tax=Streptosporangium sp. NPDC051023 TaxID=3155410 RepID=UPI00344F86D6
MKINSAIRTFYLVTGVLLLVTTSACESPADPNPKESERQRAVYGMAWSLINPDYGVGFADRPPTRQDGMTTIPLTVSRIPGEFTEADTPVRQSVDVQVNNIVGELSVPSLERTGTTLALERYVAGTGRSPQAKREVERMLTGLDDKHFAVTVLAELTEPMTEDDLERQGLSASTILLGQGAAKKPLGWKQENCEVLKTADCPDVSPMRSFRSWVATIGPPDAKALRSWRLSADSLRSIANSGKISGLMDDLTMPSAALAYIRSSHVRAVYLAAILLRQPVP